MHGVSRRGKSWEEKNLKNLRALVPLRLRVVNADKIYPRRPHAKTQMDAKGREEIYHGVTQSYARSFTEWEKLGRRNPLNIPSRLCVLAPSREIRR